MSTLNKIEKANKELEIISKGLASIEAKVICLTDDKYYMSMLENRLEEKELEAIKNISKVYSSNCRYSI